MKVSAVGLNLIKEFEGFPNGGRPYRDPIGVWTRGYGRTEGIGPNSPRISEPDAVRELATLLERNYVPAIRALGVPLNQNMFDALASFVWNVGTGGVASSTKVGRYLRARKWTDAANALLEWTRAGGSVLAGLTRRRQAERALFLKSAPVDPFSYLASREARLIREATKIRKGASRRGRWLLSERARVTSIKTYLRTKARYLKAKRRLTDRERKRLGYLRDGIAGRELE